MSTCAYELDPGDRSGALGAPEPPERCDEPTATEDETHCPDHGGAEHEYDGPCCLPGVTARCADHEHALAPGVGV